MLLDSKGNVPNPPAFFPSSLPLPFSTPATQARGREYTSLSTDAPLLQKKSGERRLWGEGASVHRLRTYDGRKPESFPGEYSLYKWQLMVLLLSSFRFSKGNQATRTTFIFQWCNQWTEKNNTWEYTSFYYVKYIPSMALTSSKGRADCHALLRLTKSFSRQVLSSYCSGAVASQLKR